MVCAHLFAASSSAFLAQSGFVLPDFFIAAQILSASAAASRTANKTPLVAPFGSVGRPIFVFILFVNKMFDTNVTFC
jgi:hypothetical protein